MSNAAKILVIGEGVTLAHVGRALVVAKAVAAAGYEVTFACDKRFLPLLDIGALRIVDIAASADPAQFLSRITAGRPMFTAAELNAAIEQDLRLMDKVWPEVIIGDMRWSLAVSARLRHIPYAAVSNAYWSRYAVHQDWVLPAHPVLQRLGYSAMQRLFKAFKPITFTMMSAPFNRVRRQYGLPPIGSDMRTINEDADFVLFPDLETLHPTQNLPPTHHYIGPISWSPAVPLPDWWEKLRDDVPVVYVSLGSSGNVDLLPMILETLANRPLQVIAATAGRKQVASPAPNIFLADYLPGEACMKKAALAITNGGSMSCYQALACGTPILGIASHLDQSLSMKPLAESGTGIMLCAPYVRPAVLLKSVDEILSSPLFKQQAQRLQKDCTRAIDDVKWSEIIETMLASSTYCASA